MTWSGVRDDSELPVSPPLTTVHSIPRAVPDPVASMPLLVTFTLASFAACFAMGAAFGGWLYDQVRGNR